MQHESFDFTDQGPALDFQEESVFARSKTSLRMHYEAQVSVIEQQIGNLEKIRTDLGLSNRKMSQLLMVDPSSWTRWTKQGDLAPPHIWRALQWYLILRGKIPGLTPQYFVGQDPQTLHHKALQKIDEETEARKKNEDHFSQKLSSLEKKLRIYRISAGVFMAFSFFLALVLCVQRLALHNS